ncbi:hypothetical protein BH11PLA2_BH11PLA2_24180 [soil metagenome]
MFLDGYERVIHCVDTGHFVLACLNESGSFCLGVIKMFLAFLSETLTSTIPYHNKVSELVAVLEAFI